MSDIVVIRSRKAVCENNSIVVYSKGTFPYSIYILRKDVITFINQTLEHNDDPDQKKILNFILDKIVPEFFDLHPSLSVRAKIALLKLSASEVTK